MSDLYLKLPLQFDGARFKTTSISDSIASVVSMIISTPKGSVSCDEEFGTAQLARDEALVELGAIKEDLSRTIKLAVEKNEPRLDQIVVKVHGGLKTDKSGIIPLKIEISAKIASTGKKFKLEKALSEDYYRTPFPGRMG